MSACIMTRSVGASQARLSLAGRFDGASAFELASRIENEPLVDVIVDFSQVTEFVDYGIAVLASAVQASAGKHVSLCGLRTHQRRLLEYFGVHEADAAHDAVSEQERAPVLYLVTREAAAGS